MMRNIGRLGVGNQSKRLKGESKGKIYVPIEASTTFVQEQRESRDCVVLDSEMNELRKMNIELKQKQIIYIDKLIKLEEGLERQHSQFMQLQSLYNELYNSYKSKEEEISQRIDQFNVVQQKYRESNHKKDTQSSYQQHSIQNQLKNQISQQCQTIQQLQEKLLEYHHTNGELEKTIEKLYEETVYLKNKDKIKELKEHLNSKGFEEFDQWQKIVEGLKQDKIKLQYQNKFLKSRNNDLEVRVSQLQQCINDKQNELTRVRQSNIFLSRQNSQNRFSRSSSSRSGHKHSDKQNTPQNTSSPQPSKLAKLIGQLHNENKQLKKQVQVLENKLNRNCYENRIKLWKEEHGVRQEEFFSFSREDHLYGVGEHSSNQDGSKDGGRKNLEDGGEKEKDVGNREKNLKEEERLKEADEMTKSESLQDLPSEQEIEKVIVSSKKKQSLDFIQ